MSEQDVEESVERQIAKTLRPADPESWPANEKWLKLVLAKVRQSAHAQGRREGLREAADRHHQHRCGLVHDMTLAEWLQQQIDQA